MPIGQQLEAALKEYLEHRPRVPHDAVWLTIYGEPFNYDALRDMLLDLEERCGVPELQAHRFRHTYATELLRRGVAVEVVAKLLGHTSITTTSDTYAHLKIEDARRALVAVGWLTNEDVQR